MRNPVWSALISSFLAAACVERSGPPIPSGAVDPYLAVTTPRIHLVPPARATVDLGPVVLSSLDDRGVAAEARRRCADGFIVETTSVGELYGVADWSLAAGGGGELIALISAATAIGVKLLTQSRKSVPTDTAFVRGFRYSSPAAPSAPLSLAAGQTSSSLASADTVGAQLGALHRMAFAEELPFSSYERLRWGIACRLEGRDSEAGPVEG